jgi:glycosyltransferase involved in cell wall biosynthesis
MDRVALELIKNLQRIDKVNEYFIFVKPDQDRDVLKHTDNFKIVEVPGGPYPLWEQFQLPKFVKQYQCDLLHCTSNTAPLKVQSKVITTLHDIIFREERVLKQLLSSASWYQKIGNLYRRFLVKGVIKKSEHLITVSNFENQNIKKVFKLENQKVTTVHNGVNKEFNNQFTTEQKEAVRSQYQLPKNFLFHIGNKDPRKNTKRLLDAFCELKQTQFGHIKLVIAGVNEETLDSMLEEMFIPSVLKKDIVLTGYIEDEDLPVIYGLAQVFLFPSLREGFGIPILEAMASGVPVITSNTSSMPEVAGDSALLINPHNTQELTQAMVKILSDEDFRNILIRQGLKQCRGFSWDQSAKKVLKIYEQLSTEKNRQRL